MKIVQVSGFYPPHLGGIEYCVQHITHELVARGHDVTVLTSSVGAKAGTVRDDHLTVSFLPAIEIAHTPIAPALIWRLLRIDRDSLIHLHVSHAFTETVTALIARARRMPYVAHFHMDVQTSGPFGFLFRAYKRTILPLVMRGASQVITLSADQRQLVIDKYHTKPDKVTVMPNGVSKDYFAIDHQSQSSDNTALRLLYVGRFARQKNLPRLLRAIAQVQVSIELHLVGDGETRTEIEELILELGLTNVVLHGRLSGAELQARYANADCFVMSSDKEGMPLALLEATAAGLPLIVSDVQGLREFVSENGIVVSNPGPATFAGAITALAEDAKTRLAYAKASRKWARDYAWSALMPRLESIYNGVRQ